MTTLKKVGLSLTLAFAQWVLLPAVCFAGPPAHVMYIADTYKVSWGAGWLTDVGYSTTSRSDLSSYAHWTNLKSDAVYIMCGHAVTFGDGHVGGVYAPNEMTTPGGDAHLILASGGSNYDPDYFISNYNSTGQIDDVLVFMLLCCDSSQTHPTYGNLLNQARSKGVDVAIGWGDLLYTDTAPIFGMGFQRGAKYADWAIDSPQGWNEGNDYDLMQYAYDYMLAQCPSASSQSKTSLVAFTTLGWSTKKMSPAAYGTP